MVGTWEREKKGAKTRASNCNVDMHTALGSLNFLLLFLCRTQSHPLWPDNHRQHPNSVGAPLPQAGGLCVLPLWWALLGAPRHRTHHSPMLGTGTGPCEQHTTHNSSSVFLYYKSTVKAANPVALLVAPHCWQKCSWGCFVALFL